MAASAVSGAQPTGRALPSLIIGKPASTSEPVRADCAAMPIASLISVACPSHVRDLLSPHVSNPAGIIARRSRALDTFRDIDSKLAPYRSKWADSLPGIFPAQAINFPLLLLLARRFDYPDKEIIEDIARGIPIAGLVPECPTLRPRAKTQL